MKIRNLIGIFLAIILLGVYYQLAITGFYNISGSVFLRHLSLPTAIVVIIFPLLFMGILNGWKNIGKAFSVLTKKDADKKILINAKGFFKNYEKTIFSMSFIAFITISIDIMSNMEAGLSPLEPYLEIALNLLLYAGIIYMVIIIPYKIIIDRKIAEIEENTETNNAIRHLEFSIKARNFIGAFLVIIMLGILCQLASTQFNWDHQVIIMRYINLPEALVAIIFPLLFMGILNGWKNIGKAFSILSKKDADKKTLINAKIFFENYGKAIFLTAFITFAIALTEILTMEDTSALWPNFAMALIMPLYAGILYIVIVIPYRIAIKRKLMETEQ